MIYITQLIYIKENEESAFQEFEKAALPIIAKYNGQLLLRVRPDENSIIENNMEQPYEIHLVRIEEDTDFQTFMRDEARKQFLHLKKQSNRLALLIKGTAL